MPPSDAESDTTDGVAIIGASGALGFGGVAIRLARAGVPIAIGSRDPDRAQEAVQRALAIVPDGSFSGHENAEAARAARVVTPTREPPSASRSSSPRSQAPSTSAT